MRFLIDASLPRSCGRVLRKLGHDALDVRDLNMRTTPDELIAAYALSKGLALVSADFDFADIRDYPPAEYHGIIVIDRPEDALVAEVLSMLERFASDPSRVAAMPGRLAIVGRSRIRFRPPLD